MIGTVRDLAVGAGIGYCSSRVMDRATGVYLDLQSEESRRLEEQVAPGGAPVLAGKKIAGWIGRDATDAEAARIGLLVHRSLGAAYGIAAAALARTGGRPIPAGIATAVAAFLVVDEGVNSALFTPPPQAYPVESHVRGIVGHVAYGVVAGAMLVAARRLGAMKP